MAIVKLGIIVQTRVHHPEPTCPSILIDPEDNLHPNQVITEFALHGQRLAKMLPQVVDQRDRDMPTSL